MELDQAIYSFGGAYVNILLGGWCVCVFVLRKKWTSLLSVLLHISVIKKAQREKVTAIIICSIYTLYKEKVIPLKQQQQ